MLQISDRNSVIKFIEFFRSNGINNNGIAGLLGNVYAESGVRSNNLQNRYNTEFGMSDEEFTIAVDNGSFDFCNADIKFGYGLCQWTSYGRRCGLYNYCRGKNVSISDLQAQCEWLLHELKTSYGSVYNELISNSNSVRSCAEIVLCKYEIPKSVLTEGTDKQNTINRRVGYAEEFYTEFLKEDVKVGNKIVAINAGHWLGNKKGVPTQMAKLGGTLEWTLNKKVVDEFVKIAAEYDGIEVLQNYDVTGTHGWTITNPDPEIQKLLIKDKTNEIAARVKMTNDAKAAIHLSIHHNAVNGIFSGGGTTVYYYAGNADNKRFAENLLSEIKSRTGLVGNRSNPVVGTKNYAEINDTNCPAFIVECGFMNSTVDIEYIARDDWAKNIAEGIMAALISEYGFTKKVTEVAEENVANPIEIVDNQCSIRIRLNGLENIVNLGKGDQIIIERV